MDIIKNKKGLFTLIELTIVIFVISIIAAICIPTFFGLLRNSRGESADSQAKAAWDNYFSSAYPGPNAETMLLKDLNGISIIVNVYGKYYGYEAKDGVLHRKENMIHVDYDDIKELEVGLCLATFDKGKSKIWTYKLDTNNNVYISNNLVAQKILGTEQYVKAVEMYKGTTQTTDANETGNFYRLDRNSGIER